MRPNDCILTTKELSVIRKHAKKVLQNAEAIGRYPTPVVDVMESAHLLLVDDNIFDEGFLKKIRRKIGKNIKKAISKVFGLLDVRERLVYVDKTLHFAKQTFIKLHETAHAILPWQRDI